MAVAVGSLVAAASFDEKAMEMQSASGIVAPNRQQRHLPLMPKEN